MYPNFNAEYARGNFTLEKLAEKASELGCTRTVPTWSLKISGKSEITLSEAKVLKAVVAPDISIDVLFKEAG